MAVIRSRIWLLSVGHYRQPGADHEEIDERAALCSAKKGGQDQSQARARQVGHSGGARARSRNGAAVCDPAINDAPSYRATEAPIGREVQREVLTGRRRSIFSRGFLCLSVYRWYWGPLCRCAEPAASRCVSQLVTTRPAAALWQTEYPPTRTEVCEKCRQSRRSSYTTAGTTSSAKLGLRRSPYQSPQL